MVKAFDMKDAIMPTAAVIDLRDGYTWPKDGNGKPLDVESATRMADVWNMERKPGHKTYAVAKVSLIKLPPLESE